MIVFLDIPLPLPIIDILPVAGIFALLYLLVNIIYGALSTEPVLPAPGKRLRIVLRGAIGLLCWILAPAALFYCTQSFLPREVRNGINSFGLDADVYIPYPEQPVLHLQGSMLLLICFSIGILRYARKVNRMDLSMASKRSVKKQQPEPIPAVSRKPQLRTESVPVVAPHPVIAPLPRLEPLAV